MGQTLSHGVYLPNEGERNCYNGLASNWQILNTAVGAIAEKAPLVHTHTVSQITDFPAYGTTAGTICEGNDSRLSDARTPVAHTHTKSDVTNLFNSANVWTGDNVYSSDSFPTLKFKNTSLDISSLPTSNLGIHIDYLDKNNVVVGGWNYIKGPDGTTRLYVELATKNSNNQDIRKSIRLDTNQEGNAWTYYPSSNGEIDLGSATNKWKTLNGINPGALSLPGASYTDISSSITDRNYGANYYTAPSNGYVCVGSMASSLQISNDTLGFGISSGTAQDGYASAYIPVRTGDTVRILLNQTSTDYQTFRFYPCAGNV